MGKQTAWILLSRVLYYASSLAFIINAVGVLAGWWTI